MDVLGIAPSSAKRGAAKIKAPLLVCVSRRETLMDPRHAEDVAAAAPRGVVRHYDGDHFQIYTRRCWLRCSPIKRLLAGAPGCPGQLTRCGTTTSGLPSWPGISARRNGPSRACAPNGPIMKCWPISSSATGSRYRQLPRACCGIAGHSTRRTPIWPAAWRRTASPASCSTTLSRWRGIPGESAVSPEAAAAGGPRHP